ncbi:MAG: 4-hydroxybenzoate octaprenyltransferase [Gammaproteobacteria bacterium]|nr:MAG: 4-hydroxybenzoate octaprenyltransferase [Gammaproteobacteria bacterium]
MRPAARLPKPEPLRPAPPQRPRRDPVYKPRWQARTAARHAGLALAQTLREYAELMRLHRPIGIWLLLWPALWALWIAGAGRPEPRLLLIFVAGVVVMRSAGCVINDYADRDFDPHVERTRERPLAARRIAPTEALGLFVVLGLVAVWLALQLEPLARLFAAAGGLIAVTYPWLKRVVHVPQFYMGVAFGWSIPMAFAAQAGAVPKVGWLLFVAVVLWAALYDTMYAMVDRDDDLKIGLKSTAILFGDADRVIIGAMQAMVLFALWLAGGEAGRGDWYRAGLAVGAVFFLWQQWLIRRRERDPCFAAFNNNHYFGMAVFIGLALDYLYS